jgi:hypothetical protein
MGDRSYVAFARPSSRTITLNDQDVSALTVCDLVNRLGLKNEHLCIRTPRIIIPLEMECVPVKKYPELLVKERPGPWDRPSVYLTAREGQADPRVVNVRVKVETEQGFDIPSFYVLFDKNILKGRRTDGIVERIVAEFGLSIESSNFSGPLSTPALTT